MAGFMSPAGLGAFVSGFAKQANTNIEEQKLEDRQNDIIWFNKFERGLSEYNKEKDKNDQISQVYNTYLKESGGNKRLTNAAINAYITNPKGEGYMQGLYLIAQNKNNPSMADTGDEQSSFMSNMQGTLGAKYQHLQDIRNSMRPQAQRFTQMPSNAPNLNQFSGNNYAPPQTSTTGPDIVPATGTGLDQQIGNAPSTGEIPLDTTPNIKTTPLQDREAAAQDNFPYQTQPGGMNAPSQSTTQLPGMINPPAQQTASGMILPPNRVDTTAQHQRNLEDVARQRLDIERQRLGLETARKPTTPEQAANIAVGNKLVERYADDPKFGLNARYAQLNDLQAQKYDINAMAGLLNKGMMAGKAQDVFDEMNRFTTSVLGLDLAQMGLTNQVSDVQQLKKDIANAMIDRLKTLHFGRITNYTESIVKQGLPSNANDPDTNVRIVLALQDNIASAAKLATLEHNIFFDPKNLQALKEGKTSYVDLMYNAKNAAEQYNNEYMKKQIPWVQASNMSQVTQLPEGSWFENSHDHRMYRYLGAGTNGGIKLQNAGTKRGGLPEIFDNVPVQ